MNLVEHAKNEFKIKKNRIIEKYKEEGKELEPGWYDYDQMYENAVIELLEVFSKQGHSGFSAPLTVHIFSILAKYEILTPLTGEDNEWMDTSYYDGISPELKGQNKRLSSLFRERENIDDVWKYSYNGILDIVNDDDVWKTYDPIDDPGTLDTDNDERAKKYWDLRHTLREELNSTISFPWVPVTHKYKWDFDKLELFKVDE
jgi:hypothetical protein